MSFLIDEHACLSNVCNTTRDLLDHLAMSKNLWSVAQQSLPLSLGQSTPTWFMLFRDIVHRISQSRSSRDTLVFDSQAFISWIWLLGLVENLPWEIKTWVLTGLKDERVSCHRYENSHLVHTYSLPHRGLVLFTTHQTSSLHCNKIQGYGQVQFLKRMNFPLKYIYIPIQGYEHEMLTRSKGRFDLQTVL